jgi:hypothetical protein
VTDALPRDYDAYPHPDDADAWVALAEDELTAYGAVRRTTARLMPRAAAHAFTLRALTTPSPEPYRAHTSVATPAPTVGASGLRTGMYGRAPIEAGVSRFPPRGPLPPTRSHYGSARRRYWNNHARTPKWFVLCGLALFLFIAQWGAGAYYRHAVQQHIAATGQLPTWTVPWLRPEHGSDYFWVDLRGEYEKRGQPVPAPHAAYLKEEQADRERLARGAAVQKADAVRRNAEADERQRAFLERIEAQGGMGRF